MTNFVSSTLWVTLGDGCGHGSYCRQSEGRDGALACVLILRLFAFVLSVWRRAIYYINRKRLCQKKTLSTNVVNVDIHVDTNEMDADI